MGSFEAWVQVMGAMALLLVLDVGDDPGEAPFAECEGAVAALPLDGRCGHEGLVAEPGGAAFEFVDHIGDTYGWFESQYEVYVIFHAVDGKQLITIGLAFVDEIPIDVRLYIWMH